MTDFISRNSKIKLKNKRQTKDKTQLNKRKKTKPIKKRTGGPPLGSFFD
jgi:hypothetical protein